MLPLAPPLIVGNWRISEFNISNPGDFNGDGMTTTAVHTELTCYQHELTINEDGTFVETSTNIIVNFGPNGNITSADCDVAIPRNGTWELSNNELAQYYNYLDSIIYHPVEISQDRLIRLGMDTPPVFGTIELIFDRQ